MLTRTMAIPLRRRSRIDLWAEVAALREAIAAFPAAVHDNRQPDYAPTLGKNAKARLWRARRMSADGLSYI